MRVPETLLSNSPGRIRGFVARNPSRTIGKGFSPHVWQRSDEDGVSVTETFMLTPELLPYPPSLITADVAFISLRLVLPPAIACADPVWRAVVLVKPQFEAGRARVQGGVVRYYLNNVVVYTSGVAPTYPLLLDTAINSMGGKVYNATICAASFTARR